MGMLGYDSATTTSIKSTNHLPYMPMYLDSCHKTSTSLNTCVPFFLRLSPFPTPATFNLREQDGNFILAPTTNPYESTILPRTFQYPKQYSLLLQLPRLRLLVRQDKQSKGGYTLVTLPRTVTPNPDSVDGARNHVTYQRLVTR
jgi:hypothetical protein